MAAEFAQAIWFYLVACVFAVLGLPLAWKLTRSETAAVGLAPICGWAAFGYLVWLWSSLHLISARNTWVWWVVLLGATGYLVRSLNRPMLVRLLRTQAAGLGIYLVYLWIRAHHADVLSGGEKPMDMALLASAGLTDYFPFADMWWGTLPINYYYFGQFLVALIANLAGVPYTLAYNFGLGWMVSLSAIVTFHLLRYLQVRRFAAACGTLLVLGSAGIAFTVQCLRALLSGGSIPVWTTAVRTYPELMQEMPAYSFLDGDLHAHLVAIPFFIALLLVAAVMQDRRPEVSLWGLFGFLTAICTLINSWSGIALAFVYAALFLRHWREGVWWRYSAALTVGIVVLMLPFLVHFRSPVGGIGFAPSFAASHGGFPSYPTPWWIMSNWLLWYGVAAICWWKLRKPSASYWALLAMCGAVLVIAVELFYLKDLNHQIHPPSFRANTVFKIGMHSWILLTVAMVVALHEVTKRTWVYVVLAVQSLVFPAVAVSQFYGWSAVPARSSVLSLDVVGALRVHYGDAAKTIDWIRANVHDRQMIVEAACESYTLCGTVAVHTGMRNSVQWRAHELGWRLANDGYQAGLSRIEDVEHVVRNVYQDTDPARVEQQLAELRADFVLVGDMERQKYGQIDESRFLRFGTLVYESPHVRLYRIKRPG